ncbi:MAG: PASTA domain-containing protein, partial [Bacteroidales bacterium]
TKTKSDENGIAIAPITIRDGLVPNVVGLGLRDALYLLESQGLRVSVSGKGKVVSQSIQGGARANKGNTVFIRLN